MQSIKLHLGCGKRFLPGYVHIDHNNFPHLDYKHDISNLPMFTDNSVSLIYAAHVLEHFDDVSSVAVLKEWYRVLTHRGVLRLAVPNFAVLAQLYTTLKDLSTITGPILGRQRAMDGSVVTDPSTHHRALYDMGKLSNRLFDVGFKSVQTWDWRKVFVGELEGFDDYSQAYVPHLDKDNGVLISLNVEAQK